ncbi:family 10 glycosylhydrolase [candidate division KSB1 bacterium]|nr:family 10 glycosylhydrolase [candidate division KSB1 bacterium]
MKILLKRNSQIHIKLSILLLLIPIILLSQSVKSFRAVKITNVDSDVMFSDQKIAEAMDYLASIGINVILPVVWNGSGADGVYTLYPSKLMERLFGWAMHPAFPSARDPLKRIVIEAHRNGMEVMPWFEMGFSTSYSQNGGHIIKKFPQWALKDKNGNLVVKNGFDWMSAINPEVQEFIISLVTEVIDNYDVDGIEFSDRIPALPVEGGYDDVTVGIYKAENNNTSPPLNYNDAAWMRWRADRLNQFMKNTRDSIKIRSTHLVFSSSPSVYPWSYQEYLQDSKTWVDEKLVDNIIPQVYRYNLNDYVYELNKSLGYVPLYMRNYFYTGMLIKSGSYVISPDFLLKAMQANRDRGVTGEAFFFYEGLRANKNLLGDTLKATFYTQPAFNPHRNSTDWRPKPQIVNENDPDVTISGKWDESEIAGFKPKILIKKDSEYGSVTYSFQIQESGWYNVFAYIITGPLATDQAHYTIYSENDSSEVWLNQKDYYLRGWQPLKTVYLSDGRQEVIKLDNKSVPAGAYIVADAAMVMINRKLSPDVIFTNVTSEKDQAHQTSKSFQLLQNYPNPFNAVTKISYLIFNENFVTLKIFDLAGREMKTLVRANQKPGRYEIILNANDLPNGLYLYQLRSGNFKESKKLILLK